MSLAKPRAKGAEGLLTSNPEQGLIGHYHGAVELDGQASFPSVPGPPEPVESPSMEAVEGGAILQLGP